MHATAVIPLLLASVSPGSTKHIGQLDGVMPEMAKRLRDLESIDDIGCTKTQTLFSKWIEYASLVKGVSVESYILKTKEKAENGHWPDSIHAMWRGWREASRPEDRETVARVATDWLRAVGWEGEEVLKEKVRLAESILEEVEALAADLPISE